MKINEIIVACDSGIATSAIGASMLKQLLVAEAIDIPICYRPLDQVEEKSGTLLVIHKEMQAKADEKLPHMEKYLLENFLEQKEYQRLIGKLKN